MKLLPAVPQSDTFVCCWPLNSAGGFWPAAARFTMYSGLLLMPQ